jgi:hypothetical protein
VKTDDEIQDLAERYQERYGDTQQTFRHLRRFYEGLIWQDEAAMTRSLVSVFRDLRHGGAEADREPDVRVTLPLIETVVAKFQALLSTVPQINVLTPPVGYKGLRKEETCRALADQNEKFFYGLWEQNRVSRHFNKQSWYLPLMGCCFQGVAPDFDAKTIRFMTRSPEHAFPIFDAEFDNLEAVIFKWDVPVTDAERQYGPQVLSLVDTGAGRAGNLLKGMTRFGAKRPTNPNIQVVQYWDQDSKTTLVGGHQIQQVKHNLGFCPWVMTPFYLIPDWPYGKGVIEGNVSLFQKLNMLDSLELQAIIENVFSRLVIINPAVAPEDIDNGPGGVIPVGQGGDVKWVGPPPITTDLSNSMGRSMDFLQRGTHLPGSMYGDGVASAITTGKAQHESMMPTGNIVEYVQSNIADSWERINEYALDMTQTIFPTRKVVYFGRQYTSQGWAAALEQPKRFMQTIQGDELQDWARHELSFQPLLNMHEKVVMGLQLGGGGLVSKRWQRDQIGIVDNNAMQDEILAEALQDQKLAALMGMAQQGAITPDGVEQAFYAMEKGGSAGGAPGAGMPPPLPGGPGPGMPPMGGPPVGLPPGGPPPGPAMGGPPGPGGQTLPVALNPGESPPTPGMPSPPASAPQGQFTLDGAVSDFARIKKLKGRVFLVGEIVVKGATDGPIEVDVTDPIDKQTIINGLPDEYHGQLQFHTVPGEPEEQHVEVGPGKKGAPGGGPVVDHPDSVTRQDPNAISFDQMPALASDQPPLASNMPAGGFVGLRS